VREKAVAFIPRTWIGESLIKSWADVNTVVSPHRAEAGTTCIVCLQRKHQQGLNGDKRCPTVGKTLGVQARRSTSQRQTRIGHTVVTGVAERVIVVTEYLAFPRTSQYRTRASIAEGWPNFRGANFLRIASEPTLSVRKCSRIEISLIQTQNAGSTTPSGSRNSEDSVTDQRSSIEEATALSETLQCFVEPGNSNRLDLSALVNRETDPEKTTEMKRAQLQAVPFLDLTLITFAFNP
jgi:hypothetical protein